MELIVLSPDKQLFEGSVESVQLPGTEGGFEIRANHAPIIAALAAGQVNILTSKNEKLSFTIQSGFVELADNKIALLLQQA